MTIHSNINSHDHIAWGRNSRASDAPIMDGGGSNPFGDADSSPLGPNAFEIRQFLHNQIGNGIHLVSIAPDHNGAISGKYFGSDADAATQWAVAKNTSGNGLYFTVNITTADLNKKLSS